MISEPVTVITDYALGAISAIVAWRLHQDAHAQRARRCWAIAFGALAISALLGGTYHGFAAVVGQAASDLGWKVTVIAVGIFSFGMLAGGIIATTRGVARAGLLAFAGTQLAVYTGWMLAHDEYIYVVLDTAIAMLILLLLHSWSAVYRRDIASCWVLAAIAASAVAASVQFHGVTLHQHFNHNDLYHVIQIAGVLLFFKGGRLLRDRTSPDRA